MTSFTALNDSWLSAAIARIEADFQRSADTHLITLPLTGFAARGIDLYLKDESTHPTGSLKHRLGGRKDGRLRGGATAHRAADAAWRPELTA